MFGNEKDNARFFSGLANDHGCVVWTRHCNPAGYGQVWYDGKVQLTHRVSYYIKYGTWPRILRHTCDNPPCCNPAHLVDGSHADNVADKVTKQRQAWGEQITSSKLVRDDVLTIYKLLEQKVSVDAIAEQYGLDPQHVYVIHQGRAWRHLYHLYNKHARNRIEIAGEYYTVAQAAKKFHISQATIYNRINEGKTGLRIVQRRV